MKLTIKRLKQLIKEELNEMAMSDADLQKTDTGREALRQRRIADKSMGSLFALGVLAMAVAGGVDAYVSKTTDYDALAMEISEMSEKDIENVLEKYEYGTRSGGEYYKELGVPHKEIPTSSYTPSFEVDLSAYAKMLADMPQEEILKHVKSRRLMQTMLQYRADIEPIAPGSSELALPKPNVGFYKESKKRRIVKRSKK